MTITAMKKIGIFGGSFNPIHTGHIQIASLAQKSLELEQVIFVPSGLPPHKTAEFLAGSADRLYMTGLAIKEYSGFVVSDYEIKKPGYSYSVETIKHFKNTLPNADSLYFIMGGDSLLDLSSWKSVDEISKLCTIVAISRDKNERFALLEQEKATLAKAYQTDIILISVPEIAVSSSEIRKRIASNQPVDGLVPPPVLEYIKKRRLYL